MRAFVAIHRERNKGDSSHGWREHEKDAVEPRFPGWKTAKRQVRILKAKVQGNSANSSLWVGIHLLGPMEKSLPKYKIQFQIT
ncbi:hypothetical protein DLM78_11795 [Leptospira stimsonii]|uniref:Uncharacterized protein n=1 Tax=Leptospira stimsonii TaxID=2202203 RepID=A0A8B3CRA2_9LEPT|nr:hypothetical protein DLM78_11795 [Leptospira stimsonii]